MKPVIVDAVAGAAAAVAAGVASAERAQGGQVLVPIGIAGVFGASTVFGFVQVRRCQAEYAKRPTWTLADMPAVM